MILPSLVLILDHYDSFTYNLVDLVRCHAEVLVVNHDEISLAEIEALAPKGVLLSPGPGHPQDYPFTLELIQRLGHQVPMLGVCLGHQMLAYWAGARIVRAAKPMHGKTSDIWHEGNSVFAALPNPVQVMRYHSLVVEAESLPAEMEVTARTEQGEIMGLKHQRLPLEGVQFHPESILTPLGPDMIGGWLGRIGIFSREVVVL